MSPPMRARQDSSYSRRQLLRAIGAGTGTALLASTGVADDGSTPASRVQAGSLSEEVWVETDTDTDGTGEPDRVHVNLVRPSDSGPDSQVPVVLRPDPYRLPHPGRVEEVPELPGYDSREAAIEANEVELYNPADSAGETAGLAAASPTSPGPFLSSALANSPSAYEDELVPEGYAFGYVAPIGASLSTGCNRLGGPAEVASVAAVIDWLNGRRTAYDSREGGEPVDTPWTDGTTGLFGESYRGALANAVATLDVDGLETVVSMRSLSSWYTYVRSEGAVISPGNEEPSAGTNLAVLSRTVTTREGAQEHCADVVGEIAQQTDVETGNYNDFWAARDYVPDADSVSASVLLVHGLYDHNTRPREFAQWLDAFGEDVPYNLWLHQGGHDDPRDRHEDAWLDRLLAWYDYWLKGEDNGVMDEPSTMVEREDGALTWGEGWPDPETEVVPLAPRPDGTAMGELAFEPPTEPITESLVDNSDVAPPDFLGEEHTDHRLVYRTDELDGAVRVNGTVHPRLTLSFDAETALVSGALVDYGPAEATIVNRGWMNPLNRDSLWESTALAPGEPYDIEFPLQPVDYVFEAGHRIGFVLYSSDYNVTKRPPSSPELTLHLQESTVDVPVYGGEDGLLAGLTGEGEGYDWDRAEENGDDNGENGNGENSDDNGDENSDGNDDENGDGDENDNDDENSDGENGNDTDPGDADDDGPGLGAASALTGLGGVSYLLKRRLDGDSEQED